MESISGATAVRSYAIVPAAGHSRRMGQPKLQMPWGGGRTVLDATLAGWLSSSVTRVVVVVRRDDVSLQEICRRHAVDLVLPDRDPPEMKDSVLAALEYIEHMYRPAAADSWLLAPADMPRLPTRVVTLLIAQHRPEQPMILRPCVGGRHGHPVLFPWTLAGAVRSLAPEQGIHSIVRAHAGRSVACCDPSILEDIDTPQQYRDFGPAAARKSSLRELPRTRGLE